ncbi:MAG: PhoU domain-containing protein [Alphaproteobacteria bacterium]|nr:PhoU domain-containing protein [Alphaproteobacteria bacterium]
MPTNDHIVKSFDVELDDLSAKLVQMGGMVEAELQEAIAAFQQRNTRRAEQVIAADVKVDQLYEAVDQQVVRMLALRQPMASDLRRIVSSLRISSDLERVATTRPMLPSAPLPSTKFR